MIVRYIKVSGTNEEIGARLAQIAADTHHAQLESRKPDALKERIAWFGANYPELISRSKGVAAYFGPLKEGVDPTMLGYNQETIQGCSVIYYPGASVDNGHAMLSRNYDFPKATYADLSHQKGPVGARSFTGDPYVIEMHPDKGYPSLFMGSYDLLRGAIDGVNSKGVAVALLADDQDHTTYGKRGVGLSEIDLPRFVLDRCASCKEARKLLSKVPYYCTFIPCHYIIGDASGDSFVFESDAAGKHYIVDGGHKPQIVTNHLLHLYNAAHLPQGNSFERYRMLQAQLDQRAGHYSPKDVKDFNICVAQSGLPNHATLWHAVYDLQSRSVDISFCLAPQGDASDRRSPYLHFQLAP